MIEDDRALPTDPLQPGITLTVPGSAVPCADGQVCWYRRDKNTGIRTLIKCVPLEGGEFTLSITTDEIDYIIEAEGECPGSEPFPIDETDTPVFPNFDDYTYARWTGSITQGYVDSTTVVSYTSSWVAVSNQNGLKVNGVVVVTPFTCDPIESAQDAVLPTYSVPWRASVSAKKTQGVFPNYRIGGFGNPCGFFPNGPIASITSAKYVLISGGWQFSDDQETIELEWTGDTSDSGPQVP